jgi:hypothetical protein
VKKKHRRIEMKKIKIAAQHIIKGGKHGKRIETG